MRRVSLACCLALACALVTAPVGAQQLAARFEIASVGDSTFTFLTGPQRWVTPRTRGIVVDPARRDALVARFRIMGVRADTVTALITGLTTRVTPDHFVVLNPPPPPPWYKRNFFWGGAAVGTLVGIVLGGALF